MKKMLFVTIMLFLFSALFSSSSGVMRGPTFSGFLDFMSNTTYLVKMNFVDYSIGGHWIGFDWLRDFINLFIQIFNYLVFCCKALINCLYYILNTFYYFFSTSFNFVTNSGAPGPGAGGGGGGGGRW